LYEKCALKTLMKLTTGRSILFASWDGEELGHLGSTAWLYRHSKELASRAMVYINLDDLIQGDDNIHVTGSPILRSESVNDVIIRS
jgi:Zn-dependent M28 family amino/carboxypeptidase